MSESSLCDHGYVYGCPECPKEIRAMKTIQERAREMCEYHRSENVDSSCGFCAEYRAALRAQLDEIQAQVEGLRTTYLWGQFAVVPKEDVLALLATLRG